MFVVRAYRFASTFDPIKQEDIEGKMSKNISLSYTFSSGRFALSKTSTRKKKLFRYLWSPDHKLLNNSEFIKLKAHPKISSHRNKQTYNNSTSGYMYINCFSSKGNLECDDNLKTSPVISQNEYSTCPLINVRNPSLNMLIKKLLNR